MNELLPYILKSTLCLSLFYLAFRVVMRKETFFALNRMVLLIIVVFSIIIPLLHLPQSVNPHIREQVISQIQFNEMPMQPMEVVESPVSAALPDTSSEAKPLPYSTGQIFLLIYLAGMLVSLLYFLHGIISVLLMLRKAQSIKMEGLFILGKDLPAFSFGKMIFISRADYRDHGTTILAHEQQHVRLGHFYDLLLMETAKMIHWFNPVIYFLIQDLKAIHEYQADQQTLTKGINATTYQLLIIEKGVGPQRLALANSFNHCQIKKRITMMNKQKTGKAWRWKVATFLPLLALLLMAFGRTGENVPPEKEFTADIQKEAIVDVQDTSAQSKEKIYIKVEVMPEFPGGEKGLREYIAKSVKYPKTAQAKDIQGKVIVNIIITSQGKVEKPKIVRGVSPELDAEALRVISQMPAWTPGKEKGKPVNVSYDIPINFVLYSGPSEKTKKVITSPPPSPSLLKIEIRKDGYYIDNRLFSLEEIRKKAEGYAGISLKVDKDVSRERVNELNEVSNLIVVESPPTTSNSQQPLIKEHKSNGALPPPPPLKSFNIEIRKDGNYIDNRLYSKEEIAKKAEAYQKSNPNAVVSIKMDGAIPQERLNEIIEVLTNANILNVKLTTTAHKTSIQTPKNH